MLLAWACYNAFFYKDNIKKVEGIQSSFVKQCLYLLCPMLDFNLSFLSCGTKQRDSQKGPSFFAMKNYCILIFFWV
jgi:hypothetical protein